MFRWEGEGGSGDTDLRFDSGRSEDLFARSSSMIMFLFHFKVHFEYE